MARSLSMYFYGKGGHFRLHSVSYIKLLELARLYYWRNPKRLLIKSFIEAGLVALAPNFFGLNKVPKNIQFMSEEEAVGLAKALERALKDIPLSDTIEDKKSISTDLLRRALKEAIAQEEQSIAEYGEIDYEAGDTELSWMKAYGLVQRNEIHYFDKEENSSEQDNLDEQTTELTYEEYISLNDAMNKDIPLPNGGMIVLGLVETISPLDWFSGPKGRALVQRFIDFCKPGSYRILDYRIL